MALLKKENKPSEKLPEQIRIGLDNDLALVEMEIDKLDTIYSFLIESLSGIPKMEDEWAKSSIETLTNSIYVLEDLIGNAKKHLTKVQNEYCKKNL